MEGYFEPDSWCWLICFYEEVKYTKNDWATGIKYIQKNVSNGYHPIEKEAVKLKLSEFALKMRCGATPSRLLYIIAIQKLNS